MRKRIIAGLVSALLACAGLVGGALPGAAVPVPGSCTWGDLNTGSLPAYQKYTTVSCTSGTKLRAKVLWYTSVSTSTTYTTVGAEVNSGTSNARSSTSTSVRVGGGCDKIESGG